MKPKNEARDALRRLIIVLVIVIGFVIYSYGWTVTDINLERPQEAQRQENVTSALQSLLSPNIFEQEREVINIYANFLVGCDDTITVEQPGEQYNGAVVQVSPDCGDPGDVITIDVTNFEPLAEGRVRWDPPGEGAQSRPREILNIEREDFVFLADGSFSGTIEVPNIRGTRGQIAQITVRAAVPYGPVVLSNTSELVIGRMAETIFMALVATTVAIPIAAMISFFAARNLMRPIKLSVGSTLIAFIALAVGFILGGWLLKPIADLGVQIGRGDYGALAALIVPVVVIIIIFLASRALINPGDPKNEAPSFSTQLRSVAIKLAAALVIVFMVGVLGGLGILGDQVIRHIATSLTQSGSTLLGDGIGAVGNFLGVLGELVALFTAVIAAAIGGFILSGVVTDLFAKPLRLVTGPTANVLGGIFGLVSGAILMAVIGQIGTTGALLGLLSPIVATVIGGQIPVIVYTRYVRPDDPVYQISQTHRLIKLILLIIGSVAVFIFTFEYLNIGRALIDGTLPPQVTRHIFGMEISSYVVDNMVIGALLGVIAGALSSVRGSIPIGSLLYNVARTILNTVRSIEPLIMGLVFVIWVGIGPFAGVLALTLHSIAALGKLYSEQVENIDDGPVEALNSTGANRLQTIIYAVVPQIVPPYIAFTMYRWDINVRMSTIIGFVGGGGIGLLLQQQINLLRYRDAGVAVLAIAVVVSILDYASASIRSRIG